MRPDSVAHSFVELLEVQSVDPERRRRCVPAVGLVQAFGCEPVFVPLGHPGLGIANFGVRGPVEGVRPEPSLPNLDDDHRACAVDRYYFDDGRYGWVELLVYVLGQLVDGLVADVLAEHLAVGRDAEKDAATSAIEHPAQCLQPLMLL